MQEGERRDLPAIKKREAVPKRPLQHSPLGPTQRDYDYHPSTRDQTVEAVAAQVEDEEDIDRNTSRGANSSRGLRALVRREST